MLRLDGKKILGTSQELGQTVDQLSAVTDPTDAGLFSVVISSIMKKITWANLKTVLQTWADGIYQTLTTALTERTRDQGFDTPIEQYYEQNTGPCIFFTNANCVSVAGTQSDDPTNVLVQEPLSTGSVKILENDNTANQLNSTYTPGSAINFIKMRDGSASAVGDFMTLGVYISDATKIDAVEGIQVVFATTAFTDYYAIKLTTGVTGANIFEFKKSDCYTIGSPNWNSITEVLLGWTSINNSQNTYISFNFVQLVKSNPEGTAPLYFQKNGVADYTEASTNEWFIGPELGEVVMRNIKPVNTTVMALYGNKGYTNCMCHWKIKVKTGTTDLYGFSWAVDATNGIYIALDGTDAILGNRVADSAATLGSTAFTFAVNDIIDIFLIKVGTAVYAEIWKNETSMISVAGTTTISATSVGYLALRSNSASTRYNILKMAITSTEYAHRAGMAGLARNLIGFTNNNSGYLRSATAINRRYYHIPASKTNPGAAGATWVAPSANGPGGWQLNADTEFLYMSTDVHDDWDGESDLTAEIFFQKNTTAAVSTDTSDLKLQVFYGAVGDAAYKTQAIAEAATVVGADAQYTMYKASFTIDWNAGGNVVEKGDRIGFILNLETDTSECADITVNSGSFYYNTTHTVIESGDV